MNNDAENFELLKNKISKLEHQIELLKQKIENLNSENYTEKNIDSKIYKIKSDKTENGNIIIGIFDGQNMKSDEGKKYTLSANYASKSKLVEGDKLKLTILNNGTFIYKQIGPVDRKNIIGTLSIINDQFFVKTSDKKYLVLPASITYFKAKNNDKLAITIPQNFNSKWAAVDGVIS
jgi:hypothetical protein